MHLLLEKGSAAAHYVAALAQALGTVGMSITALGAHLGPAFTRQAVGRVVFAVQAARAENGVVFSRTVARHP